LKNMRSSMGRMTSHTWKIKFMFETTNQINIDPEHHQFLVETNLNQPLSGRVYVNLLKGMFF
jgi:hypothetical protein